MACLRENSIRWTSPSLHSSALRVLSSSSSPETKIGRRRTKKKEKRRKKAATTAAAEEEEGAKKYVTLRSTSSRRDDVLYSIFPLLLLLLALMTSILRWRSSYDHYKERSIKSVCVCACAYFVTLYEPILHQSEQDDKNQRRNFLTYDYAFLLIRKCRKKTSSTRQLAVVSLYFWIDINIDEEKVFDRDPNWHSQFE